MEIQCADECMTGSGWGAQNDGVCVCVCVCNKNSEELWHRRTTLETTSALIKRKMEIEIEGKGDKKPTEQLV